MAGDAAAAEPPGDASRRDSLVRQFLVACHRDEAGARGRLLSVLHDEITARAGDLARRQGRHEVLRVAAIVHDLYARLVGTSPRGHERSAFLSAAAGAMRRVLVDRARDRHRRAEGVPPVRIGVEELLERYEDRAVNLLELDSALDRLADFNPLMAHAVELRFFGGASKDEIARLLGMARKAFDRSWEAVRAWLRVQIT